MAKLIFLAAVLLVASAILADAHTLAPPPASPPAPPPAHPVTKLPTFNLKCIIHNVAKKDVSFKLVIEGKDAGRTVLAKAGKWTAIGPVKVGCKVPIVHVCVTVKTWKGVVSKTFPVQLKKVLKNIVPNCSKVFVLTAVDAKLYGKKVLLVKLNHKVVAVLKVLY